MKKTASSLLFEEKGHDFSCAGDFQIECDNKAEEYEFNSRMIPSVLPGLCFPRVQIFSENAFTSLKGRDWAFLLPPRQGLC